MEWFLKRSFLLILGGLGVVTPAWSFANIQCEGVFRAVEQAGELPGISSVQKFFDSKSPGEALRALKAIQKQNYRESDLSALQQRLAIDLKDKQAVRYEAILDIFDMKKVSELNLPKAKEPVDLVLMTGVANRYLKTRQKLKLDNIKSFEDFTRAGKALYGIDLLVRDYGVVMSGEVRAISNAIELIPQSYNYLKNENPLITVTASRAKPQDILNMKAHVEYFSLVNWSRVSEGAPQILNERIQRTLERLEAGKIDETHRQFSVLTQEAVAWTMERLLSDPKSGSVFLGKEKENVQNYSYLNYQAFMSLHPYTDGNGRMGRLLYDILSQRASQQPERQKVKLNLPFYDLDLFIPAERYPEFIALGTVLKAWILRAKDDAEFIRRSAWSVELFFRLYPEYRSMFPEVGALQ